MSACKARMQAAVLLGPETIEIRDVAVPEPETGQLLIKVGAATTCGTDVKVFLRGGHPRMLKVPTLFGHEFSGTIEKVGASVAEFEVGERVVVANSAPCGHCERCQQKRENLCSDLQYLNGAFAEFILIPERFVQRSIYRIPPDLSFARAALSEPLACVLHGMSACELTRHQDPSKADSRYRADVVIYGGGPIGLLFVAALARDGHRVLLADPNPSRLQAGSAMGAAHTLCIARGGGQAGTIRELSRIAEGVDIAIDCTGLPEVWMDAIDSVRAGGLVNLFGGCAPGTEVKLDTHRLHYSEITVKGVYHHRPETFHSALQLLSEADFPADVLLGERMPIAAVEMALRSMIDKSNLKVLISAQS